MSRKAAFDAEDEPESKRPRLSNAPAAHGQYDTAPYSLETVNDDCLLLILSYLPTDDLNNISICSKRYQKARAHESLDQTRTGTIVISEGCTFQSLVETIATNGWNQAFQGNQTHLVLKGLDKLQQVSTDQAMSMATDMFSLMQRAALPGVTILTLECSPPPATPILGRFTTMFVSRILLNTLETRVRNLVASPLDIDGYIFSKKTELTDLSLDNCCFEFDEFLWYDFVNPRRRHFLLSFSRRLKRLSIKNATFQREGQTLNHACIAVAKMVLHHPTLQWLRSDLTPEQVALLKQPYRPDITFVSDFKVHRYCHYEY